MIEEEVDKDLLNKMGKNSFVHKVCYVVFEKVVCSSEKVHKVCYVVVDEKKIFSKFFYLLSR